MFLPTSRFLKRKAENFASTEWKFFWNLAWDGSTKLQHWLVPGTQLWTMENIVPSAMNCQEKLPVGIRSQLAELCWNYLPEPTNNRKKKLVGFSLFKKYPEGLLYICYLFIRISNLSKFLF